MHKVLKLSAATQQRYLVDLLAKFEARFSSNSELRQDLAAALTIAKQIKVEAANE